MSGVTAQMPTEFVDVFLRDRVTLLAAARAAAFPPGVPHLPALQPPTQPKEK